MTTLPNPLCGNQSRLFSLRRAIETTIEHFVALNNRYDTPVPGLNVARIQSALPPTAYLYEPSLCICVRGSKHVLLGAADLVYDENNFLLTTVGLPTIITVPDATTGDPYTALQINFNLDLARQTISEMATNGMDVPQSDTGMSVGTLTEDLLDAVWRLVQLIERPQDIAILSDLIHREILYRVLNGPNGDQLRRIMQVGSQHHRVSLVVSWLRANFSRRVRLEELAEISAMGVSTLHRHFKNLTTMSPLQFQKQLCLHEARRLMLIDGLAAGDAALAVGYESATQFNREYRRLFGAPPLRNVNSLRGASNA